MVRRTQKRITWKKEAVDAARATKRPRQVVRVFPRADEHVFVPGQLFRLNCPLEVIPTYARDAEPPFPYVGKSWYVTPMPYVLGHHSQGSLAIFMGHTRVEEMDGLQPISLLRATFFINGVRCMPVDLNCFDFIS